MKFTPLSFGTYVYKILNIGPHQSDRHEVCVFYENLTELGKIRHHYIRARATFPYDKLVVGEIYTIVSVNLNNSWHFLYAFPLSRDDVLVNEELKDHLHSTLKFDIEIPE